MKRLSAYICGLWVVMSFAQNKQLIYGIEEIPQSLLLNPGSKVRQKMHIGVPFLSQLHVNAGASGLSTYDIFGNSNVDINTRIRNKIFEMKNTDFFTLTQQLNLIDFGWRSKSDIYFSGGIYQEFDFILYFPRDLAILGWEGNRDYLDYEFDLGELNTTGDFLTAYHFGASKQISKKLNAGVRIKLYSSMFSYRSTKNSGSFVTRLGDGSTNIYEHTVQDANILVQSSGYASLRELDGASEVTSKILERAFFGGNFGVGVDLGATYDINDYWTASASILDVGAIFHSKDVESYHATGTYTLDGIELLFPPLSDGESTFPYYQDLEDEIEREIPIDTLHNSYTQMRPVKTHGSISYSFGRPVGTEGECNCRSKDGGIKTNQSAGIQLYTIFRPKSPQWAGTLFYYRRFSDYFSAKATYTIDLYSFANVGLGIVTDIGKFNFYLAADNLIYYGNIAKAKSVSLQVGFNIKFDEE